MRQNILQILMIRIIIFISQILETNIQSVKITWNNLLKAQKQQDIGIISQDVNVGVFLQNVLFEQIPIVQITI